MKLTYIFHSGFALETSDCLLVFDFWMDPANVLEKLFQVHKRVYVFSSHFHEDHFNREILTWRDRHPDVSFTYILSKDILKRRRARKEEADVWLAKGGAWSDEKLGVVATGSTDSGVSWIVRVDGRCVFHAGDLNNWYAKFLSDGETEGTIMSDEFGEVDPVREEKAYLGELKDIQKVSDHFDLVMFPVDGRIGNGYTRGARQFIDRFSVGLFVPMHFVASGYESAWRMREFTNRKGVPFWCIAHNGDSTEF